MEAKVLIWLMGRLMGTILGKEEAEWARDQLLSAKGLNEGKGE